MTRTRILIAAAALAAVPAATFAGDTAAPAGSAWDALAKRFDLDADGRITWEEYQKVTSGFASLDANRDGVITREEVPADGKAAAEALARLGGLTVDGPAAFVTPAWGRVSVGLGDDDGEIFGGECKDGVCGLDAKSAPWVAVAMLGDSADADHDSAISKAEWDALLGSLQADSAGVVPTEALSKAVPEVPAIAAGVLFAMVLDADKDGKIELDDLRSIFDVVDANKDGRIDAKDKPSKSDAN